MHPAARKTVERVLGIEWSYHLLDFDMRLGVVGRTAAGDSIAANIPLSMHAKTVSAARSAHSSEVEIAKEMILKKLMETTQCTSPTT